MHRLLKPLSLVLLLACSAFFFVGVPADLNTRSAQRVWDLGHVAFFFAGTVVWLRWGRSTDGGSPVRQWILVLASVTVIGLGVEGIQMLLGRSGSLSDVFRNLVGAVLALAFFSSEGGWRTSGSQRAIRASAILLLLMASAPLVATVTDEISASRAFPVLSDFETPFQLSRWGSDVVISIERDTVREGGGAMRVPLSTDLYSTAGLVYFPGDWSGASILSASVFNPDPEPLALHLRVHDEYHDAHGQSYSERFNTTFTITTGWNDLSVPLSEIAAGPRDRLLDLTRIAGMSFFSVELPAPRTIFIDQVELR